MHARADKERNKNTIRKIAGNFAGVLLTEERLKL
jgi:hypothetical protein